MSIHPIIERNASHQSRGMARRKSAPLEARSPTGCKIPDLDDLGAPPDVERART